MVMLSDGSEAWGISDSGMIHLPLGRLYEYPILQPETTKVFLAKDDCNRGVATGVLKVNNLGKGQLTFSVVPPATRRSCTSSPAAWRRRTSVHHGTGTLRRGPPARHEHLDRRRDHQGTPFNITLSSPEAINVPPIIRVYMNYRQSDQRGVIYPFPPPPTAPKACRTSCSTRRAAVCTSPTPATTASKCSTSRSSISCDPIPVGQLPHRWRWHGRQHALRRQHRR